MDLIQVTLKIMEKMQEQPLLTDLIQVTLKIMEKMQEQPLLMDLIQVTLKIMEKMQEQPLLMDLIQRTLLNRVQRMITVAPLVMDKIANNVSSGRIQEVL